MVCCYNVDWLEVYCWRTLAFNLSVGGYTYRTREYGTRIYAKVVDVYRDNQLFATICCDPLSKKSRGGILDDASVHVKLANYWLYTPDFVECFRTFLLESGLTYKSISRIDLCCDCQYFQCGIAAAHLVRGFCQDKYTKLFQPRFAIYGIDNGDITYNSIRFGSPTSCVVTRIYNKSLELKEVKDKKYIRECWSRAGLKEGMDVWRTEYQITGIGKMVVDKETGEVLDISLHDISNPRLVALQFLRFAHHYGRFYKTDRTKRKLDCNELKLFDTANLPKYGRFNYPHNVVSTRTDKQIIRKLTALAEDETIGDEEVRTYQKAARYLGMRTLTTDIALAKSRYNEYISHLPLPVGEKTE